MAKLPRSFRDRNLTTRQFREQYQALPKRIQFLVRAACLKFHQDPTLTALRLHRLEDRKAAKHEPGSYWVSITMQYRAIFFTDDEGRNVWYWIGTHADYDELAG